MNPRLIEVAAERYWLELGYKTRRATRNQYQKVDIFAADLVAKCSTETVYVQVTGAQNPGNIRKRKRKLEEQFWAPTDRVLVFELEKRPSVNDKRIIDYYFRVHEYHPFAERPWWDLWPHPILIQRDWFKVSKNQTSISNEEPVRPNPPEADIV